MKLSVEALDIRVMITDDRLIAHILPHPLMRALPTCEVFDMEHIPVECLTWIHLLERTP